MKVKSVVSCGLVLALTGAVGGKDSDLVARTGGTEPLRMSGNTLRQQRAVGIDKATWQIINGIH